MEWNVLSWLTWRYGCIMEDSESQLLCRPTGRTRFSWIQTLGLGFVLSKMFLTRLLTAKLERLEIIKCKKKAMGTDKPFKINKKPNEAAERRERSYQFLPTPVRSLFIPDPDLDFLPIPNPWVKREKDPGFGSVTLVDFSSLTRYVPQTILHWVLTSTIERRETALPAFSRQNTF